MPTSAARRRCSPRRDASQSRSPRSPAPSAAMWLPTLRKLVPPGSVDRAEVGDVAGAPDERRRRSRGQRCAAAPRRQSLDREQRLVEELGAVGLGVLTEAGERAGVLRHVEGRHERGAADGAVGAVGAGQQRTDEEAPDRRDGEQGCGRDGSRRSAGAVLQRPGGCGCCAPPPSRSRRERRRRPGAAQPRASACRARSRRRAGAPGRPEPRRPPSSGGRCRRSAPPPTRRRGTAGPGRSPRSRPAAAR